MFRFVDVQTAHGPVKFHYCISTPDSDNASEIVPTLPTLLFLHPVFFPMQTFHEQFRDPEVRRFNLVAVDVLRHGLTVGTVPGTYRQNEAAADIAAFMDALSLPPCVVVGLSMGTIIGIQLAVSYPTKVTALFLVSPLGSKEPQDVADGRIQIANVWKESFQGDEIDEEAVSDTVFGALQLGFNSEMSARVDAIRNIVYPLAFVLWGPDDLEAYDATTCMIFTERRDYTKEELAVLRLKPVALIVCGNDIAYSPQYATIFEQQLISAGVSTKFDVVPGAPHFGVVTHPEVINPKLVRFVLDQWKGGKIPPGKGIKKSPFDAQFREAGWHSSGEDSE